MSLFPQSLRVPAPAAFNPAAIDHARQSLQRIAMNLFSAIDLSAKQMSGSDLSADQRSGCVGTSNTADYQRDLMHAIAPIHSDPRTLHQVVDDALWKVLHMSATVAAHHAPEVQDRVDKTTVAVMSALYPHKPMMQLASRPSLLYRCVRETTHVFGPETLAMIASRYDQCFREKELLDHTAMDLFEQRYHRSVLDGYTSSTCRPPPYSAAV
jgi:hypothetical protein